MEVKRYKKLKISGKLDVSLVCQKAPTVMLESSANHQPLTHKIEGDTLLVSYNGEEEHTVRVYYEELTEIKAKGVVNLTAAKAIRGSNLALSVHDAKRFELPVSVNQLTVDVIGDNDYLVRGSTNSLEVSMKGAGFLNMKSLDCKTSVVSLDSKGKVHMNPGLALMATLRDTGELGLTELPPTNMISNPGNGKVVQLV